MIPGLLFAAGERAYQIEKSYNALLGISRKGRHAPGLYARGQS